MLIGPAPLAAAVATFPVSRALAGSRGHVLRGPLDEILRLSPDGGFGELLQQFRQLRRDAYLLICLRHWLVDLFTGEKMQMKNL